MNSLIRWLARAALGAAGLVTCFGAAALTPEQIRTLALGDNDERIEALNQAVARGDGSLGPFVEALLADEVKTAGEHVYIVRGGQAADAATGTAAKLPDDAQDVVNSNRMRRALEGALAGLKLLSADAAVRD